MTPVKTNLVLLCLALVLPAMTFVVLPRLPALHRVVPVKTSIQTSFPPSTLAIEMSTLGRAPTGKPLITNVQIDDLDQDGLQDVLASDAVLNRVVWYQQFAPSQWKELILGDSDLASPSHVSSVDLNGDQSPDVVLVSIFNDWHDKNAASVVWLENDGQGDFSRTWQITNAPSHLATVAVGDLNRDGRADIVAGSMHLQGPRDRLGRVTLWKSLIELPK